MRRSSLNDGVVRTRPHALEVRSKGMRHRHVITDGNLIILIPRSGDRPVSGTVTKEMTVIKYGLLMHELVACLDSDRDVRFACEYGADASPAALLFFVLVTVAIDAHLHPLTCGSPQCSCDPAIGKCVHCNVDRALRAADHGHVDLFEVCIG